MARQRACKPFTRAALKRGMAVEHKEHPSFSRAAAKKIARDHLCKNPKTYRRK